jgi:hypothetical protein
MNMFVSICSRILRFGATAERLPDLIDAWSSPTVRLSSEHAGDRGLEEVVGAGSCAGQDESVTVGLDRMRAIPREEEEQVREPHALAAFEGDRLELTQQLVLALDPGSSASCDVVQRLLKLACPGP